MANQPSSSPLELFDAKITAFIGAESFKQVEDLRLLKPIMDIVADIRDLLKNVTPEDVQGILEQTPGNVAERVRAIVTNTNIGALEETGIKNRIMEIVGEFFKNILKASILQSQTAEAPAAQAAPQRKKRGPYKKRRAKTAPDPDAALKKKSGKNLPPEEFERYIERLEEAITATINTFNGLETTASENMINKTTITVEELTDLAKTMLRCMPFMQAANTGLTVSIQETKTLMAFKYQREAATQALHRVCPKIDTGSAQSFYAWAKPTFTEKIPKAERDSGRKHNLFALALDDLLDLPYPGAAGKTVRDMTVE